MDGWEKEWESAQMYWGKRMERRSAWMNGNQHGWEKERESSWMAGWTNRRQWKLAWKDGWEKNGNRHGWDFLGGDFKD